MVRTALLALLFAAALAFPAGAQTPPQTVGERQDGEVLERAYVNTFSNDQCAWTMTGNVFVAQSLEAYLADAPNRAPISISDPEAQERALRPFMRSIALIGCRDGTWMLIQGDGTHDPLGQHARLSQTFTILYHGNSGNWAHNSTNMADYQFVFDATLASGADFSIFRVTSDDNHRWSAGAFGPQGFIQSLNGVDLRTGVEIDAFVEAIAQQRQGGQQ